MGIGLGNKVDFQEDKDVRGLDGNDTDFIPHDADEIAKYKRRVEVPDKLDQPMSVPNSEPPIIPMVVDDARRLFPSGASLDRLTADLLSRQELGVRRYGVALQPFNGRDCTKDAYAEALDLCNYLKQRHIETRRSGPITEMVSVYELYVRALTLALDVASLIKD